MANATTSRVDSDLDAQSPAADLVRVYLNGIGKTALLNAADEVELAKRIEAGLFATQKMAEFAEKGEKLPVQLRRDMQWICRDGDRAKTICWRRTCVWWCRWPSATPAAAWRSST